MSLSSLRKTLKLTRPYETVDSIKDMTVEEILSIDPKEISTTSIVEDPRFKQIDEMKQNAVKYIATRKRVKKSNDIPYENIVNDFKKKYGDEAVREEMIKAWSEVSKSKLDDARFLSETKRRLHNIGGKRKKTKKQSKKGRARSRRH